MFTIFQRTVVVVLAFGFLVVALVVAAKAPAQATTFAPAVSVPVNAVIPPGIVTTGDATVKAKPDGAIVTIGAIVQAGVWPTHMTVLEAVLMARFYHFNRPPAEAIADATALARLFGLPGLPVGRSETTPLRALIRAACVRGFLGSPDLIVVQDHLLDQTSELAVPMAQAISAARDRGATVLWITASLAAQAVQFVQADHLFRLGDSGLVPVRRSR